jgi:Uma2 family endonuclease
MSEEEYRRFALTAEGRLHELWDGVPREKPLMNLKHADVASYLGFALIDQLDRRVHRVNVNGGRTRCSARDYYIPDVIVIPYALQRPYIDNPDALNAYAEPLPLVVEVWSWTEEPYDFATKLQAYRQRWDEDIWYFHPFDRTLTAWHKNPMGATASSFTAVGSNRSSPYRA